MQKGDKRRATSSRVAHTVPRERNVNLTADGLNVSAQGAKLTYSKLACIAVGRDMGVVQCNVNENLKPGGE